MLTDETHPSSDATMTLSYNLDTLKSLYKRKWEGSTSDLDKECTFYLNSLSQYTYHGSPHYEYRQGADLQWTAAVEALGAKRLEGSSKVSKKEAQEDVACRFFQEALPAFCAAQTRSALRRAEPTCTHCAGCPVASPTTPPCTEPPHWKARGWQRDAGKDGAESGVGPTGWHRDLTQEGVEPNPGPKSRGRSKSRSRSRSRSKSRSRSRSRSKSPHIATPAKRDIVQLRSALRKATINAANNEQGPAAPRNERKSRKAQHSTFAQTLTGAAKSVGKILLEKGIETIASITASGLAVQSPHLLLDGKLSAVQPAGATLLRIPISANMFNSPGDRLQKQLSLFSKYRFTDSKIRFRGASGALVSGQIGMFVCPDPTLQIVTTNTVDLQRLVRQYDGEITKVTDSCSLAIPNVNDWLFVTPDPNTELRLENQGTFYVIAITDLDSTVAVGEFALDFGVQMTEPANTGMYSTPEPPTSLVSYNASASGTATSSTVTYVNTFAVSDFSYGKFSGASRDASGRIVLNPGIYRVSCKFDLGLPAAVGTYLYGVAVLLRDASSTIVRNSGNWANGVYNSTGAGIVVNGWVVNYNVMITSRLWIDLRIQNFSSSNYTFSAGNLQVETISMYPVENISSLPLLGCVGYAQKLPVEAPPPLLTLKAALGRLDSAVSSLIGKTVAFSSLEEGEYYIREHVAVDHLVELITLIKTLKAAMAERRKSLGQ